MTMAKNTYSPPAEFTTGEALEYYNNARKFCEPSKRRSRRHLDEELCFFSDRFEKWLGCAGSNHDASELPHEDRDIALAVHRGLIWLRDTYGHFLMSRVSAGEASYTPHDWRPKLKEMRAFLIESHNSAKITFPVSWAKKNRIYRDEVSRDFADDSKPVEKLTTS